MVMEVLSVEYLVSHWAIDDMVEHTGKNWRLQISALASFEYVAAGGKDLGKTATPLFQVKYINCSILADFHQVYERIKAPLLILVSPGGPEQSFAVLSHLHLLVMRAPYIFSSDYKQHFCQYNEPFYVKKLKLEMLTAVANESNTHEIVTELCEYAADVYLPIVRESIRAVGKIALQRYDVNAIVDRLLQFLEMEKDYVTANTLVLVKDLLRKYFQWSQDCIAIVGSISSKNVQEPKAKPALIWMLGEYAQDMLNAPYILESLTENWDEEQSAEVRLHILTAAVMKCFFRRPPETQKALGSALAAGLADFHQEMTISPQGVAALTTPQNLLRHLQGQSIHCIASGGQMPNFKFFYAQKANEPSN